MSESATEISFDVSDADAALIDKIMKRADSMKLYKPRNRLNVEMSLTACHANGTQLDLQKLLGFDEFNFVHDVCGIDRHTSRETGKLTDHFLPRCARH